MSYDRALPLTLALLRQEVASNLRGFVTGTVDTGTTLTIQDNDLMDSAESNNAYDRAWIRVNGETRRLASYNASTGTITLGRVLTNIAAGVYEIHQMLSPEEVNECVNKVLTACSYEHEQAIAVVAAQAEYDLAAYEWITSRNQVTGIFLRQGDTATEYRYISLPWWRVGRKTSPETAGGMPWTGVYLQVKPLSTTTDYLVIRGMRHYAKMTSDASVTTMPFDWLIAGAEAQVYRLLTMDGPAEDRTQFVSKYKEANYRFAMKSRENTPRPCHTVMLPDAVSNPLMDNIGLEG